MYFPCTAFEDLISLPQGKPIRVLRGWARAKCNITTCSREQEKKVKKTRKRLERTNGPWLTESDECWCNLAFWGTRMEDEEKKLVEQPSGPGCNGDDGDQ